MSANENKGIREGSLRLKERASNFFSRRKNDVRSWFTRKNTQSEPVSTSEESHEELPKQDNAREESLARLNAREESLARLNASIATQNQNASSLPPPLTPDRQNAKDQHTREFQAEKAARNTNSYDEEEERPEYNNSPTIDYAALANLRRSAHNASDNRPYWDDEEDFANEYQLNQAELKRKSQENRLAGIPTWEEGNRATKIKNAQEDDPNIMSMHGLTYGKTLLMMSIDNLDLEVAKIIINRPETNLNLTSLGGESIISQALRSAFFLLIYPLHLENQHREERRNNSIEIVNELLKQPAGRIDFNCAAQLAELEEKREAAPRRPAPSHIFQGARARGRGNERAHAAAVTVSAPSIAQVRAIDRRRRSRSSLYFCSCAWMCTFCASSCGSAALVSSSKLCSQAGPGRLWSE